MKARLSIIIPVWNRAAFLRDSVESLLSQGIEGLEVIVSDDGSTDGSLATIEDLPVVSIPCSEHRGISAARNRGIARATGDYIGFLDSDDIVAKDGLKWRLEFLESSNHEIVACDVAGVIDKSGKLLGSVSEVMDHKYQKPKGELSLKTMLEGQRIAGNVSSLLLKRSLLDRIGAFDEKLGTAEDFDFIFRVVAETPIPFFERPGHFLRVHDNNISGRLGPKGYELNRQMRAEGFLVRWMHEGLHLSKSALSCFGVILRRHAD